MNALKLFAVAAVGLLGLYGCAKAPLSQSGDERTLHETVKKLEAENQAIASARDQYRHKLQTVEKQYAALVQDHENLRAATAREAAALIEQLKTRTVERDNIQVQYDGFRKNIKELIGQAEASLPAPAPLAATSVAESQN